MPRRAILFTLVLSLIALGGSTQWCAADDTVTLRPASPNAEPTKVRGNVIDYTGQVLTLQTASGQTSIPSDKIASVETDYASDVLKARQLLDEGKSSEAARMFAAAYPGERRPWVKREILALEALALQNAGRYIEAGNAFLKIVAEDPQTIHFDAIPLAWFSLPPHFERDRAARGWMEMSSPYAQLLGASWLLSTSDRSQAIQVLGNLRRSKIPQISLLAEAQLWQTKIVTASQADVQQWQRQLDAGILRGAALAGPTLVVGKAWRQLDNDNQAALTLMRPPILYPNHRPVAADSLLQAGRALERAGQSDEAARVLREAIEQYGDQPARQEAEINLKRIASSGSN
ncbi:tetratricopeptide repeat protein [Bremerella sp. P1]|uniref:tetratricopeptide repeat protein n=1 Tax=Bremerella sp. P1 TaxID=3026424 RepID=UPI0023679292|nr:tetratricopeptide repeat protein [Bremerella sp. P1]WDI44633.1 tetratricopeptide repeat protein [Bremerella sp. P1]